MDAFLLDLRHALRALRKNLSFTVVAVGTLAAAIAATTTIFAVVDASIIRPLPFPDADRLVQVHETTPDGSDFSVSEPDYLDFRAGARSLDGLAAFRPVDLTLTSDGDPRQLRGFAASRSLLSVLGVRPILGRPFGESEDLPGQPSNVVLLGGALWQSRFHGDSTIVGRTITLDGRPATVIGVLPVSLRVPAADVIVPLHANPASDRGDHWLTLVGRLRPTASMAMLRAELETVTRRIAADHPTSRGWGTRVESLFDAVVDRNFRLGGWVLLAATGLLLLLGCANVANLLLARATTRRAEMGVRAAIGAGRGRLVCHWLTESAVIVALASVLGVLGAAWATSAIHAFGAGRIPRIDEVAVNARVVGAAVLVAVLTTLACGLFPALRASRIDPAAVLGEGTRTGPTRRQRGLRHALVVTQVMLSVTLLIGAGLLLRSFAALSTADVGFDAEHVLTVKVTLPEQRYDEVQRSIFYTRLTGRLAALPGVSAVGATVVDPFSGWNLVNDVTPEERLATTSAAGFMQAAWRTVTPDFFAAMGITVLRGRVFSKDDLWNGPRIVVVSRSLADAMWPNEDPVGKRLYWGSTNGRPREVVGVVNDIRDVAPQTAPRPTLFLPSNQVPMPGMAVVVRTAGDPLALTASVRESIRALDPTLPVDDIHALSRNRFDAMTTPRFNLWLMTTFGVLALLLAGSGVYAVVAFSVVQRRREIGIRLAVGAAPSGAVLFFLRGGAVLVAIGIGAGAALAWAAARLMAGLLYGVTPSDPLTFGGVALLLALVAFAAIYIPARRAARVSPVEALRS
jgi:predicted permease